MVTLTTEEIAILITEEMMMLITGGEGITRLGSYRGDCDADYKRGNHTINFCGGYYSSSFKKLYINCYFFVLALCVCVYFRFCIYLGFVLFLFCSQGLH